MSFNHNYTQVNDFKLHYLREGSGLPLLLVHGWPEYWRTWRKNISDLADYFDVIVPDLRGFGESERSEIVASEGYGIKNHTDDLMTLVDKLGIDKFGFVSHDLGAYVGQRIARRQSTRLRGLFFFDCPYPGIGRRWRDPEHVDEIWYQSFNQQPWAANLIGANRDTCRMYINHFLTHWAGDPDAFDEADREKWVTTFNSGENLQGGFDWYIAADDARKRLMRDGPQPTEPVKVPTRILWGEADPIVKSEWADRLDEYFADYQLDTVPGAGHFVQYERPELANNAISSFFSDLA